MFTNNVILNGSLTAVLKKVGGRTEEVKSKNLILDSGFEHIASSIIPGDRPTVFSYIAVGTAEDSTEGSQTSLKKEIAKSKASATYNNLDKTITFEASFYEGVTGAITEAGVCSESGVFLDRSVFPVLNKESQDELVLKFIISFKEG